MVVVVDPHHHPIAEELHDLGVQLVDSEQWYEGRTASVQSGCGRSRRATTCCSGRSIIRSSRCERSTFWARPGIPTRWAFGSSPRTDGDGGHPVLWKDRVRADVLELRPDAPIRALIPELGPQVRRVAVDDPGVLASIDTPEEYRDAYDSWLARRED